MPAKPLLTTFLVYVAIKSPFSPFLYNTRLNLTSNRAYCDSLTTSSHYQLDQHPIHPQSKQHPIPPSVKQRPIHHQSRGGRVSNLKRKGSYSPKGSCSYPAPHCQIANKAAASICRRRSKIDESAVRKSLQQARFSALTRPPAHNIEDIKSLSKALFSRTGTFETYLSVTSSTLSSYTAAATPEPITDHCILGDDQRLYLGRDELWAWIAPPAKIWGVYVGKNTDYLTFGFVCVQRTDRCKHFGFVINHLYFDQPLPVTPNTSC